MWRTDDGGATWQKTKLPRNDTSITDTRLVTAELGYLVGRIELDYNHVGVWRTSDGGRSWQATRSFWSQRKWRILAATPTNLLLQGGDEELQGGGEELHLSLDGGKTWQILLINQRIHSAVCSQAGYGWVTRYNGELLRLTDFGQQITSDSNLPDSLRNQHWQDMALSNGIGLLVSAEGALAATYDDGRTWQEVNLLPASDKDLSHYKEFTRVQVRGRTALVFGATYGAVLRLDL